MNKPFEGDKYIGLELIKLRDRFGLTSCCETGTQYGSTAELLAKIFEVVYTIEADKEYFIKSVINLNRIPNVYQYWSKSEVFLITNRIDNVLFYLDAHGCEIGGCALKKELEIIATQELKNACIAIHDFKNPEHPEFGYDTYDYELCYEEVEPYIKKIYPEGFDYHYNDAAEGAMRGIAYFYPKQK